MTKSVRESNIELLRIIAIFLILVVHANYLELGVPSSSDLKSNFFPTVTRVFIQSLSIICVNVFVVISGWFGIHTKIKSMMNFIFQCIFFSIIVFCVNICMGGAEISRSSLIELFVPGWFPKCYLVLMVVAPILNQFVETCSEKRLRYILIAFFSMEFLYGFLSKGIESPDGSFFPWLFLGGQSATSLIGIYLLTRYFKLHLLEKIESRFSSVFKSERSWSMWFFLWMFIVFADTLICCVFKYFGFDFDVRFFSYTNPIIILQSLVMFMTFEKMRIRSNKVINGIAASSFAAVLLHMSLGHERGVTYLYNNYSGIGCLMLIFLFLSSIFLVSILLDQIRIRVWRLVERYIPDYKF